MFMFMFSNAGLEPGTRPPPVASAVAKLSESGAMPSEKLLNNMMPTPKT